MCNYGTIVTKAAAPLSFSFAIFLLELIFLLSVLYNSDMLYSTYSYMLRFLFLCEPH